MDNVCHTLVGAALAESGLRRRTSLAVATLLIGANLPDLDALAYFAGPLADLEWRRGWSHGVIAMAVLPFVLTGLMLAVDRVSHRMRRAVIPSSARPAQLLLLSFIAILTHPILDTLNTYGVRWLLPWNREWTYGDTLFIIDPWIWLTLGLGVWLSRRRRLSREWTVVSETPARRAIALTVCYILVMAFATVRARGAAAREMQALHPGTIGKVMAGPVPVNPFARQIVVQQGNAYRTAAFSWLRDPHIDPASVRSFSSNVPEHPAVATASSTVAGRRFLGWARFPRFVVDSEGGESVVHMIDMRYATSPGTRFGSVSIEVPELDDPQR